MYSSSSTVNSWLIWPPRGIGVAQKSLTSPAESSGRSLFPEPSTVSSCPTVTDFGIGAPVKRREDPRLLRGDGRFADDFNAPGQAYAAFVRSPHAHADVLGIDDHAARAVAGVLGV